MAQFAPRNISGTAKTGDATSEIAGKGGDKTGTNRRKIRRNIKKSSL